MKILLAYDGSILADAAIEDLRRAGLPQKTDALVVCVEDGLLHARPSEASSGSWPSKLAYAEMLAEKATARIASYFPGWTVSREALLGSPAKVILDTAARWRPDLIVAGSHGRSGVARLLLGSVSLELAHKAPGAVRVARDGGRSAAGPIRIVIGNDGSTEGETAVRWVATRFWPEKTEAKIISAVQTLVPAVTVLEASTFNQEPAFGVIRHVDEQERDRLRNIAGRSADLLQRAGLTVSTDIVDGDPREVILQEAERLNADAIFVGARGMGRMERLLLGSVSTYLVTHAHCSVEIVRRSA
jgi:nucleotide-binding universal stress UspA family protein